MLGAATCKVCSLPALFSLAAQLAVRIVLHQVATGFGGCCCHFHEGLSSVVWPSIWAVMNETESDPFYGGGVERRCRSVRVDSGVSGRSVHAQLVAVIPLAF